MKRNENSPLDPKHAAIYPARPSWLGLLMPTVSTQNSAHTMQTAYSTRCVNSEFCTLNANRLFNQRCQLRILHTQCKTAYSTRCVNSEFCTCNVYLLFNHTYVYICQLRILHTQWMPWIQPYTHISTQNYAHSGDQFYTGLTYNSLCDASPQQNPLGKHSLSLNWPYKWWR